MRRIGFVLNPIAGMGGRVGLKGTDNVVEEARARGATPHSPDRALRALKTLAEQAADVQLLTWGDPMGEQVVTNTILSHEILGAPEQLETTAEDTIQAVRAFIQADVDVILFAGGDGTAVDIAETLTEESASIPILGIPAGVKIFSSVFAVTPEAAGEIVATFDRTESREVMDLDEEAYRSGEVASTLRAVVEVPVAEETQVSKQLSHGSVDGLVCGFIETMDPDATYFLGPGSTIGSIKEALDIQGTPLGVDIYGNGRLLVADAAESDLREYTEGKSIIVVSPIGGQGFIFGRGNHQFSPAVIRASDVELVASRAKLDDIGILRVDTGDLELDEALRGWTKVRIGRVEQRMMQIQ